MDHDVDMVFKKETKGTVVYESADSNVCRSIYVLKEAFPNGHPKELMLTLRWEDSSTS